MSGWRTSPGWVSNIIARIVRLEARLSGAFDDGGFIRPSAIPPVAIPSVDIVGAVEDVTIAAGSVTVTGKHHVRINGEGAAPDTCTDIIIGDDGYVVFLEAVDEITLDPSGNFVFADGRVDTPTLGPTTASDAVLVIAMYSATTNLVYLMLVPHPGGGSDASTITYTPAADTDWSGDVDPGNVDAALDQLAARVEAAAAGDAATITYTPADDNDWVGDVDPGNVNDALDQLAELVHGLTAHYHIYGEVPTGTIDGANADFVLALEPAADTLRLYKNGMRQQVGAGNDYTLAVDTITFEAGNLPQTGDALVADYDEV